MVYALECVILCARPSLGAGAKPCRIEVRVRVMARVRVRVRVMARVRVIVAVMPRVKVDWLM